jgi:hypothetical protein
MFIISIFLKPLFVAVLFIAAYAVSRAILSVIPDGAFKRFLNTSVPQRDKAD